MERSDEFNKPKNAWLSAGVSAIITAALVGGGVFWWQNEVAEKTKQENMARQQELENQIQSLQRQIAETKKTEPDSDKILGNENWNTYRNEEYGFQLKLPPEWEEYSVKIEKGDDTVTFDDVVPFFDNIYFNPVVDYLGSKQVIPILNIVCCPISKIPEIEERCNDEFQSVHFYSAYNCQPIENSIGQNDKYVFSYMKAHDLTEDLESQVEDVIKTFVPIILP